MNQKQRERMNSPAEKYADLKLSQKTMILEKVSKLLNNVELSSRLNMITTLLISNILCEIDKEHHNEVLKNCFKIASEKMNSFNKTGMP